MRFALAHLIGIVTLIGAAPCVAQTRVTSLEDLRRVVAPGDEVTIVADTGESIAGRLMRLGDADLELQVDEAPAAPNGTQRLTIPFDAMQLLERRPDSVRNGTLIGASIGAGVGAGMFVYAALVDRNELDEWAPIYAGVTAAFAGAGALVGWLADKASAKPHISFVPSRHMRVSLSPVLYGRRGVGITMSARSR